MIAGICVGYMACVGAALTQEPVGYTVAGKIVDRLGDDFNVVVPVTLYAPFAVFEVMSDKTGAFKFKHVPAGHYQLQAQVARSTNRAVQEVYVSESTPALEVTLSIVTCLFPITTLPDTLPSYQVTSNSQQAKLSVIIDGSKPKRFKQ